MLLNRTCQFMFLITALMFLCSCDSGPKEPRRVKFLNDSFSVLMPNSWSVKTGLNDQADLQMANYYKEAYSIILTENKADFDDISVEDHSNLTRETLTSGLKNMKESAPNKFKIGEYDAVKYEISGSIEGIKAVYWHVTVETSNHFHQILVWSLKSKFASNKTDFNQVIMSLKEEI